MAHRNRWFTELKNGGSFHGYVKKPDGIIIHRIYHTTYTVIYLINTDYTFESYYVTWLCNFNQIITHYRCKTHQHNGGQKTCESVTNNRLANQSLI